MARNLARNTRLFVTTLDISGEAGGDFITACDAQNTFEVKVLDGYSFSQDVATQEVGTNEADSSCSGSGLARGTLSFNTALNPVDVSFSTYVRPYDNTITIDGTSAASADCVERILWGSTMGSEASWNLVTGEDSNVGTTEIIEAQSADSIKFGLGSSNTNSLMDLTLFFVLQQTTYKILNFNVTTAEVDFSIDGIATINWTGQGSRVLEDEASHSHINTPASWVAGTHYQAVPATTTNTFLRNKLSVLEVTDNEGTKTTGDQGGSISSVTDQAITTDINIVTANSYDGGRIYNADTDTWATIVSHTTGAASIVTVSVADDITTWDAADVIDIFLPSSHAGVVYCIPITGATLTLENNITYLTPEELAIVNLPLPGFAGNRVTSGSFTAYLNTGAQGTGGLLQDMLVKIQDSVSNNYHIKFYMGNNSSTTPRVEFDIPHANLSVPTTNVEDLITTEITFSAKPWDVTNDVASFEDTNEVTIEYFG